MKMFFILVAVGLILSGAALADPLGHFDTDSAGTDDNAGTIENNPDRWPSLTLDGIYNIYRDMAVPSVPALQNDTLMLISSGHQVGVESLFKLPVASRVTLRLGIGYLQHTLDNNILGERNMTKDDFRFRVGLTIYFARAK